MIAALKLEIYENGEFLREVPFSEEELWVGRDAGCVIRLEDRAISRKHGSFKISSEGVDFAKKSTFGEARVNGKDVEQVSLKNGDRLSMGPYEIRVKQSQVEVAQPVAAALLAPMSEDEFNADMPEIGHKPVLTQTVASTTGVEIGQPEGIEPLSFENHDSGFSSNPTSEALPQPTNGSTGAFDFARVNNDASTKIFNQQQAEMKAVLQFSDGTDQVQDYEITDDEVAIGRSQKCHIVLEDKRSSRKHSIIRRENKKYIVKDLGSANGTLVNGERIDEHELQAGDIIQIGDTKFTFQLLQADYEVKKEQFITVPHIEASPHSLPGQPPPMHALMDVDPFQAPQFEQQVAGSESDFAAPPAEKKSLIGKFLDRYRAMNTRQQIIYGAVILVAFWLLLDDDAPQNHARLNMGNTPKAAQKKVDKKPGSGQSFESLTPEQQNYIKAEYQLAFDLYKTREYDNSLLEVGKIFSLVQDYKNAREIEAFAREGKRKLEAQEEERKKKEAERQAQIRLQTLIEQVGMLMEKKRFVEAEALFPEIELLQPENAAVATWRKEMITEKERLERELTDHKRQAEINKIAWTDFSKGKSMASDLKKYWDALDVFDEILTREVTDKKLIFEVKRETKRLEDFIVSERDPIYTQAKALEQEGKITEAYKMYQRTLDIDPTFKEAQTSMERIKGSITGRVKVIYAEGVFAESYSDWDTAEKRYREVMDSVSKDDSYFVKADSRLKKLLVLRLPASSTQ